MLMRHCYLSSDGLGINKFILHLTLKLMLHPTGMMESLERTCVLFILITYPQKKEPKKNKTIMSSSAENLKCLNSFSCKYIYVQFNHSL